MLALTLGSVAMFTACDPEVILPEVTASFTSAVDNATGTVTFTNTSTEATTYAWTFGDGNSSSDENPTNTYAEDGDYTVTLIASSDNDADTATATVTIALEGGGVDETAPVITLTGEDSVSITLGSTYEDAGAMASDDVDGDISANILVNDDALNTSLPGTYSVTYNVSDAAGNAAAEVTRRVTVTWDGGTAIDGGLIGDGGFENGGDGWDGNALQVITLGDNSYQFADVATAGNTFDVNLSYGLEIEQGQTYELKFTAFSGAARTMDVGIGLYQDPWTADVETITLGTTPEEFTLELSSADFGNANSRVIFDMGADVGIVIIDNVSLVKTSTDDGGDGGDSGDGEADVFCETTVKAFGGDAGSDVIVSIYNVNSTTLEIALKSADDDPVDALVLPAGDFTPVPGFTAEGQPQDNDGDGTWVAQMLYPEGTSNVTLYFLWSKVSFEGNWQSHNFGEGEIATVDFNQVCPE